VFLQALRANGVFGIFSSSKGPRNEGIPAAMWAPRRFEWTGSRA
jgi:hypothetical protein